MYFDVLCVCVLVLYDAVYIVYDVVNDVISLYIYTHVIYDIICHVYLIFLVVICRDRVGVEHV